MTSFHDCHALYGSTDLYYVLHDDGPAISPTVGHPPLRTRALKPVPSQAQYGLETSHTPLKCKCFPLQ